jgi:hypothetical protein
MHNRPPLNHAEFEIRDLLEPKSTVNRDQLIYDCGYEAAKSELALDTTSLPPSGTASKRRWLQWLPIVSTTAAAIMCILFLQQSAKLRSAQASIENLRVEKQSLAIALNTAFKTDTAETPAVALANRTNSPSKRVDSQPSSNSLALDWINQSRAAKALEVENWLSQRQPSVAFHSSRQPRQNASTRTSVSATLRPQQQKNQRQLWEELSKSMF